MQLEIEAKFLNINHDEMRAKLRQLGAKCQKPMRLMRRVTIDTPLMKKKAGWIRVRHEGDKITLAYKQIDSLTVDGVKEIEVEVSSFDDTIALLSEAGLVQGSFQESKRETWHLDSAEIELDEWPWLNPYMEIEAGDEQTIKNVAGQLGLNWQDACFGDVMTVYQVQYPHLDKSFCISSLAQVKFGDPLPDVMKKPL